MTITLQIDALTVTAEVNGDRAEITRVTDAAGHPVHTTPDDLDRIEAAIFSQTTVEATDTDLGGRAGQTHYVNYMCTLQFTRKNAFPS